MLKDILNLIGVFILYCVSIFHIILVYFANKIASQKTKKKKN